ncbi:MAG TPA: branched-chain amino acid ABC transporter substrate-binding protein, partial [Nautiliaceae bacterium]|nr:branched-chain amino acid ABC transporter substrate-binding protein [Nautiliaceae bacterium]
FKQCVNNALRNSKNIEAVTGYLTIDPKTGNPINKPAVIKEIKDSKAVFKELIKP